MLKALLSEKELITRDLGGVWFDMSISAVRFILFEVVDPVLLLYESGVFREEIVDVMRLGELEVSRVIRNLYILFKMCIFLWFLSFQAANLQ
jgi:hypothetical protein